MGDAAQVKNDSKDSRNGPLVVYRPKPLTTTVSWAARLRNSKVGPAGELVPTAIKGALLLTGRLLELILSPTLNRCLSV
jgi:hypothetical protein